MIYLWKYGKNQPKNTYFLLLTNLHGQRLVFESMLCVTMKIIFDRFFLSSMSLDNVAPRSTWCLNCSFRISLNHQRMILKETSCHWILYCTIQRQRGPTLNLKKSMSSIQTEGLLSWLARHAIWSRKSISMTSMPTKMSLSNYRKWNKRKPSLTLSTVIITYPKKNNFTF